MHLGVKHVCILTYSAEGTGVTLVTVLWFCAPKTRNKQLRVTLAYEFGRIGDSPEPGEEVNCVRSAPLDGVRTLGLDREVAIIAEVAFRPVE